MPRIAITIFVLLVVGLCSCSDDEPIEPCRPPCQLDESFEYMVEWCYFEVGTWWKYEEQNTGAIDSVYVWNNGGINYEAEAFELWTYSSHHDYDWAYIHHAGHIGPSNESSCQLRRLNRGAINPPHFVREGYIGNFPFIENDFSGDGNSSTQGIVRTEVYHDSYTLGDLDFGETVEFSAVSCPSELFNDTHFTIAKNIGIIKRYIPELNEEWNLIDYNVIQ